MHLQQMFRVTGGDETSAIWRVNYSTKSLAPNTNNYMNACKGY